MTRTQPPRHDVAPDGTDTGESRGESEETPRSLRRLTCLSVTHRTHSTDLVGSIAPTTPRRTACSIYEHSRVTEAMVLSTCNRLEIYVSTRTPDTADRNEAIAGIRDVIDVPADAQIYTGRAVVDHLAGVTAGLDSAILGEDEIAGQVSEALAAAKEAGLVEGVLGRVGNTALRAGRTCRTRTAIDEGAVDYGSAVCRTLAAELDESPDHLLVIGAGDMARTVAETATCRWDLRVDIANRSPAQELTTPDGRWWLLEELESAVSDADAIVSATNADRPVLEETHASTCEATTPVVDLATPPDVSEAARSQEAISVTGLDTVASAVNAAAEKREAAIESAETIINDAVERLVERERENRAEAVIRELHQDAACIRESELQRARQRLDDGAVDTEEVLEDLASALTGRLLGPATDELRTAARERDETALRAARRLFDLNGCDTDD